MIVDVPLDVLDALRAAALAGDVALVLFIAKIENLAGKVCLKCAAVPPERERRSDALFDIGHRLCKPCSGVGPWADYIEWAAEDCNQVARCNT